MPATETFAAKHAAKIRGMLSCFDRMGIFVGGISVLAPSRRDDLSALAFRALASATLATLMTGALAGLYCHGQQSLLGL
jgi:CNT family concentrative nucleoside transporter